MHASDERKGVHFLKCLFRCHWFEGEKVPAPAVLRGVRCQLFQSKGFKTTRISVLQAMRTTEWLCIFVFLMLTVKT